MIDLLAVGVLHIVFPIPVVYLVTRRQPNIFMASNVVKRTSNMLGLVRLTDDKSVKTYGHASSVRSAFFVEHIKLIDDHIAKIFRRNADI